MPSVVKILELMEKEKSRKKVFESGKHRQAKKNHGRPLKFNDTEKLRQDIENYFSNCDTKKEMPTITGLATTLRTSRKVLCDYANGKYDTKEKCFSDPIKKAKIKIENQWLRFSLEMKLKRRFDYAKPMKETEKSFWSF